MVLRHQGNTPWSQNSDYKNTNASEVSQKALEDTRPFGFAYDIMFAGMAAERELGECSKRLLRSMTTSRSISAV